MTAPKAPPAQAGEGKRWTLHRCRFGNEGKWTEGWSCEGIGSCDHMDGVTDSAGYEWEHFEVVPAADLDAAKAALAQAEKERDEAKANWTVEILQQSVLKDKLKLAERDLRVKAEERLDDLLVWLSAPRSPLDVIERARLERGEGK